MQNLVVGRESYGSDDHDKEYIRLQNGSLSVVDYSRSQQSLTLSSLSSFFRSVFLPQGYPESVSEDYLTYQIWDTVQAFASSITGALATQAVLKGVGVGDEGASVMAATITWLMKDGTGMVGRILFAWIRGSDLDCDCKRWRLFADILNDAAICLEILAPFFENFFRIIICVAGIFKSIVGVAGGATRAAITQHQARRNNMADVSAKDGSQETLVNLAALIVSLVLLPLVTGNTVVIWILFMLCTMLHLYSNYQAVKCVTMETFNQARLHIVVQHYLSTPDSRVMGVRAANSREPVLWSTNRQLDVRLGSSIESAVKSYEEFEYLVKIYSGCKYLLNLDLKKGTVNIILHRRSSLSDQLQACFQAEVLDYVVSKKTPQASSAKILLNNVHFHSLLDAAKYSDAASLVTISAGFVKDIFPKVCKQLEQQGWSLEHAQLGADEWRAIWDLQGLPDKKIC